MIQQTVIKRLLAGIMLVLFALGITPKKALHDLLTHHTDKTFKLVGQDVQVEKAGFNCQCENLVAESPFDAAGQSFVFAAPVEFIQAPPGLLYHFYSSPCFFFGLRGPPAIA